MKKPFRDLCAYKALSSSLSDAESFDFEKSFRRALFSCKNKSFSAKAGFSLNLFFDKSSPAAENNRSEGALKAGLAKTIFASDESLGN